MCYGIHVEVSGWLCRPGTLSTLCCDWFIVGQEDVGWESQTKRTLGRRRRRRRRKRRRRGGRGEDGQSLRTLEPDAEEAGCVENEIISHEPRGKA